MYNNDLDFGLRDRIRSYYLKEFSPVLDYVKKHLENPKSQYEIDKLEVFERVNEVSIKTFYLDDEIKQELKDFKKLVEAVNSCLDDKNCGSKLLIETFFKHQTAKTEALIKEDKELLIIYENNF